MRRVDEIHSDMVDAINHGDVDAVLRFIDEAASIKTPESAAMIHCGHGWLSIQNSNYPAAHEHYNAEVALRKQLADVNGEASAIGNIGNVYILQGQFAEALESYQRAYDSHSSVGNRDGMARMLGGMATVYNRTGNYAKALELNNVALQIHVDNSSLYGQAQVLGNIGNLFSMWGNYPEALDYMMRSLDLHHAIGDRMRAATVLGNIGTVYGGSGDIERAIDYLQQALDIQTEIGNGNEIARLSSNLGYAHLQRSEFEVALRHLNKAYEYHVLVGNRQGMAHSITYMIDAFFDGNNIDEARRWLHVLDSMSIDEPDVAIHRADNHARLSLHDGDITAAQQHLQSALDIATKHELRYAQAEMHKSLRDLCQETNDLPSYIKHNNEYTRITTEIHGKEATQKVARQEAERRMAEERKEHEKHMAVLHSTLPKHIADRVARGEVVNDSFDNASVLFLDVVGFTTNSSALDASVVVALLQDIFTTFDAICEQHDVMKIKTIGDSYMAVAFDVDATGQPPRLALYQRIANVAHAMMSSPFTWPHTNEPVIFRIGLHCGPVIAGVLGTERLQYDVWGDTVNVASRMESTGEPGRIHVSEAFADALRSAPYHNFTLTERGTIDVKGKGAMMTYWLEGA